jgi:hypothetical protein
MNTHPHKEAEMETKRPGYPTAYMALREERKNQYKVQVHTDFGWADVISGVRQVTVESTRKTAEARARRMRNQGRNVRVVQV